MPKLIELGLAVSEKFHIKGLEYANFGRPLLGNHDVLSNHLVSHTAEA